MSLEIKVPPVGESITEVTLASWLKKDGDSVEMDEALAELESDKATFELTAEKAGILKRIAKEGDVLPIGAVVCSIEDGGAASTPTPKAEAAAPKAATAPVAFAAASSKQPITRQAHHRLPLLKYWPKKVLNLHRLTNAAAVLTGA